MAGSEEANPTTGSAASATTAASAPCPTGTTSGLGSRDQERQRAHDSSEPEAAKAVAGVRVNCLMNARYHAAREAFLDGVHRWLMFGVIACGAGAVVELFPDRGAVGTWLSAIAALFGALDLTFDLSNRARAHALMKRRYFELLADLSEGWKSASEVDACTNRYSADEEPAYHALLSASWNAAQEMVYGDDAELYEIPKWHRLLQHVRRFEGFRYDLKDRRRAGIAGADA